MLRRIFWMFTLFLLALVAGSCVPGRRPPSDFHPPDAGVRARAAVRGVLQEQVAAWNRGDIEAFMDGYARADSLRFASGGVVHRGWRATLDRYRASYPDRAAMGTLTFTDVDVKLLGEDQALVFGRWCLERAEDAPHGLFTLLLEKRLIEGGNRAWRIVHDHTSAAD